MANFVRTLIPALRGLPKVMRAPLAVLVAVGGLGAPLTASAQVQFPGPVVVPVEGDALSAVAMPLEVGDNEFFVSGSGDGVLALQRYSSTAQRFLQLDQFLLGGRVVHLIPWEGQPLLDQGIVAATANPDRVVFLRVQPQPPYFTVEDQVALPEDPGTLSFVGEIAGGTPELAVSLPGIDQVAFLRRTAAWDLTEIKDTGDQPHSILGVDLDGDQVRELVTANRGWLAGTLGVFRREAGGSYLGQQREFAAGYPDQLAGLDLDGDGRLELAATVKDTPVLVLLRGTAGQPEVFDTLALTLPADGVHLSRLFDGSAGLFASNRDRALVDFFRLEQDVWTRLNSYYPGTNPVGMTAGDFNGDGGRDLLTVGGDTGTASVMFANPEPGFWGFPALALDASPGSSVIADFDADGWSDLVVSNGDQPRLSFFAGQPGGGFTITAVDVPLPFFPGPVVVVNTDDDPGPELAVLDSGGDQVHIVDHPVGEGFSLVSATATGDGPTFLTAADADADGFIDLQVITREEDEVTILFGAGDHTFPAATTLGLINGADGIAVLDLNDDNLPDLALSDGVNRIWTTLNTGSRSFTGLSWVNAGSGASILAVADLDQDQDEDLIAVNSLDESLSMFENDGSGALVRRIGAHTLGSAPTGIVIQDLDLDDKAEIVLNLREDRLLGIVFPLGDWEYSQVATFAGGPDVTVFTVADLNLDEVPDILTLDRSLLLGLTLLNVEQQLVAVAPRALSAACEGPALAVRIEPDRDGPWRLELGGPDGWLTLVESGHAWLGSLDYERGVWTLRVDRAELAGPLADRWLRLTVGEGSRRESLDLSLAELCPAAGPPGLPRVAFTREPWPNPFNPVVNARFSLTRGAPVEVAVYDLAGRQVAVLADRWFAAGEHDLWWDGRARGRSAGAGVYLLRIHTPDHTLNHKIMLVK